MDTHLLPGVAPELFPPPPGKPDVRPDIRVAFILAPKFTLMAFASFIEGLRHAADEADFSRQIYCQWKVIAPSLGPIYASCGIKVFPQETFLNASEFDHLVIVGGLVPDCLSVPVQTLEFIQVAHRKNATIVGLCTGSFIIARAGLLEHRICAVDTVHHNQIRSLFPNVIADADKPYVIDDIVTCRGGTAPLSLVVSLITSRCGRARATKALAALQPVPDLMAYPSYHRPYGQMFGGGVRKIEQAMELMEKHIARPLKVSRLAYQLNTSARELNRLFSKHVGKSPTHVGRELRLAHGHWLLVNSPRTVTQIALECGFSDGAHFSRWFRQTYGESPIKYRDQRRHV